MISELTNSLLLQENILVVKIRIGVIGSGDWGKNHLRVFSEIECDLVGLADIRQDRKSLADQYKIKFFTDYKQMLPLVDAVSIVVPTDLHYGVVKDCLLAGKHVFVEKPITLDHKSSQQLIDLAQQKGLILAVGYLFRFNSAVKKLKEEIKNIGDIQYVTGRFMHSNKPPRRDSGVIFNFGVHLIDILNYVLPQKPKKVYCKKMNYLSTDKEDAAMITLDYGNFFASLEMTWFHPLKKRDLWVIGSKAKIYADLFEQILIKYPLEIDYNSINRQPEVNLEILKNEPLLEELKAFCHAVSVGSGKDFTGKEEVLTTKICELACKSAEDGKEHLL